MRSDPFTGKPLVLYKRGSCRRCITCPEGVTHCNGRWPPWPYVCGGSVRAGRVPKCKVNIPRVEEESMYAGEIAAENTRGGPANAPKSYRVNWNQMSDRAVAGIQKVHVPRQRTRHRPGGNGQTGRGVDVKHGSYQRYLNRKKGNLKIELFHKTPDFYNEGCPCYSEGPYFSQRAYGQNLKGVKTAHSPTGSPSLVAPQTY